MKKSLNFWTRKLHRWGAVACCLPLLAVILSGLLLQVKKQVAWVQPPTQSAGHARLELSWNRILQIAASDPQAGISSWEDIDRLDVRPSKGMVKVQARNRHELQIDLVSGKVLSSSWRRSDLIESLHDGSFFGEYAKGIVFLANGLILLGLWITGAWLWYLPIRAKSRKRKRKVVGKPTSQTPADPTGKT